MDMRSAHVITGIRASPREVATADRL